MTSRRSLLQPKSIYECVALLGFIQFTLCCNSYWRRDGRFKANKWTRLYTLVSAVMVLLGLAYAVYAVLNDPRQRIIFADLEGLVVWIAVIELVMSSVCMFSITVVSMQHQAHRHVQLYERINNLDRRLMREFGAKLNYYKLLRKNIIIVGIVAAAYVSAICSALVQVAYESLSVWLLGAWCYIIVTGGPHLSGYVHMNLAEIIRIRFRLLQRILSKDYMRKQFPEMVLREQRLLSAVEMVKELHLLINEINAVYMMSLIAAMAHDFTLTTSELYFIFGRSIGGNASNTMLFYVAICMILPLYKMLLGPIYCENTMKEGKKCINIVKGVDAWFPKSEIIRRSVDSLLYWRLDEKIEFTIGMNMKLNKTMISMITIVIFNYLLIMIQFRMTQEMGAQIEQQKNTIKDWIGFDSYSPMGNFT